MGRPSRRTAELVPVVNAPLRTLLFVPGNRPDQISKALVSGADAVIVDLEDAVALAAKDAARAGAVEGIAPLPAAGCSVAIRLNALATGMLDVDLAALARIWKRLDFIVLPMVPDGDTVQQVAARLKTNDGRSGKDRPTGILPLIETADGVLNATEIARADPRVLTLTFGPADLSAQLGIELSAEGAELSYARSRLVLAAAASGLPGPVNGPWLDLEDQDGLERSAQSARRLGFRGQQIIHPCQLETVRAVFKPTADQVAWARAVETAFTEAERSGIASIRLDDGSFVDYPIARRARDILEQAE